MHRPEVRRAALPGRIGTQRGGGGRETIRRVVAGRRIGLGWRSVAGRMAPGRRAVARRRRLAAAGVATRAATAVRRQLACRRRAGLAMAAARSRGFSPAVALPLAVALPFAFCLALALGERQLRCQHRERRGEKQPPVHRVCPSEPQGRIADYGRGARTAHRVNTLYAAAGRAVPRIDPGQSHAGRRSCRHDSRRDSPMTAPPPTGPAPRPKACVQEVAGVPYTPVEMASAIALGVVALLIAGLLSLLLSALAEEHRLSVSGIGMAAMLEALSTGLVSRPGRHRAPKPRGLRRVGRGPRVPGAGRGGPCDPARQRRFADAGPNPGGRAGGLRCCGSPSA